MKRQWTRDAGVLLSVLLVLLVAAQFTGIWPWTENTYNSYSLQACSWLEGRLDLGQDYPWLELAIYEGKYYVSFPPFPSYVLLPFAAVTGPATPDGWIALAVTLLGVWYAMALYREAGGREEDLGFWVLFLFLGSGYLFIAINGWVWFLAQTMCFTLMLMALVYALRGRGGLSLTCWACAVGCRPMTAIYFPLLAFLLIKKLVSQHPEEKVWRLVLRRLYWAIGPCVLAGSYMALNQLRFGSVLEFGHNYLPEFVRAENGQFSLSYLKDNLLNLLRLPYWENGALHFHTVNGMAFWMVDPLFIAVIAAWLCECRRRASSQALLIGLPLLSVAYVLILCCHRTLGGWQFGDRYLLDVLPPLFLGLVLWAPRSPHFKSLCTPLLFYGAALNLVGTVLTYRHII